MRIINLINFRSFSKSGCCERRKCETKIRKPSKFINTFSNWRKLVIKVKCNYLNAVLEVDEWDKLAISGSNCFWLMLYFSCHRSSYLICLRSIFPSINMNKLINILLVKCLAVVPRPIRNCKLCPQMYLVKISSHDQSFNFLFPKKSFYLSQLLYFRTLSNI